MFNWLWRQKKEGDGGAQKAAPPPRKTPFSPEAEQFARELLRDTEKAGISPMSNDWLLQVSNNRETRDMPPFFRSIFVSPESWLGMENKPAATAASDETAHFYPTGGAGLDDDLLLDRVRVVARRLKQSDGIELEEEGVQSIAVALKLWFGTVALYAQVNSGAPGGDAVRVFDAELSNAQAAWMIEWIRTQGALGEAFNWFTFCNLARKRGLLTSWLTKIMQARELRVEHLQTFMTFANLMGLGTQRGQAIPQGFYEWQAARWAVTTYHRQSSEGVRGAATLPPPEIGNTAAFFEGFLEQVFSQWVHTANVRWFGQPEYERYRDSRQLALDTWSRTFPDVPTDVITVEQKQRLLDAEPVVRDDDVVELAMAVRKLGPVDEVLDADELREALDAVGEDARQVRAIYAARERELARMQQLPVLRQAPSFVSKMKHLHVDRYFGFEETVPAGEPVQPWHFRYEEGERVSYHGAVKFMYSMRGMPLIVVRLRKDADGSAVRVTIRAVPVPALREARVQTERGEGIEDTEADYLLASLGIFPDNIDAAEPMGDFEDTQQFAAIDRDLRRETARVMLRAYVAMLAMQETQEYLAEHEPEAEVYYNNWRMKSQLTPDGASFSMVDALHVGGGANAAALFGQALLDPEQALVTAHAHEPFPELINAYALEKGDATLLAELARRFLALDSGGDDESDRVAREWLRQLLEKLRVPDLPRLTRLLSPRLRQGSHVRQDWIAFLLRQWARRDLTEAQPGVAPGDAAVYLLAATMTMMALDTHLPQVSHRQLREALRGSLPVLRRQVALIAPESQVGTVLTEAYLELLQHLVDEEDVRFLSAFRAGVKEEAVNMAWRFFDIIYLPGTTAKEGEEDDGDDEDEDDDEDESPGASKTQPPPPRDAVSRAPSSLKGEDLQAYVKAKVIEPQQREALLVLGGMSDAGSRSLPQLKQDVRDKIKVKFTGMLAHAAALFLYNQGLLPRRPPSGGVSKDAARALLDEVNAALAQPTMTLGQVAALRAWLAHARSTDFWDESELSFWDNDRGVSLLEEERKNTIDREYRSLPSPPAEIEAEIARIRELPESGGDPAVAAVKEKWVREQRAKAEVATPANLRFDAEALAERHAEAEVEAAMGEVEGELRGAVRGAEMRIDELLPGGEPKLADEEAVQARDSTRAFLYEFYQLALVSWYNSWHTAKRVALGEAYVPKQEAELAAAQLLEDAARDFQQTQSAESLAVLTLAQVHGQMNKRVVRRPTARYPLPEGASYPFVARSNRQNYVVSAIARTSAAQDARARAGDYDLIDSGVILMLLSVIYKRNVNFSRFRQRLEEIDVDAGILDDARRAMTPPTLRETQAARLMPPNARGVRERNILLYFRVFENAEEIYPELHVASALIKKFVPELVAAVELMWMAAAQSDEYKRMRKEKEEEDARAQRAAAEPEESEDESEEEAGEEAFEDSDEDTNTESTSPSPAASPPASPSASPRSTTEEEDADVFEEGEVFLAGEEYDDAMFDDEESEAQAKISGGAAEVDVVLKAARTPGPDVTDASLGALEEALGTVLSIGDPFERDGESLLWVGHAGARAHARLRWRWDEKEKSAVVLAAERDGAGHGHELLELVHVLVDQYLPIMGGKNVRPAHEGEQARRPSMASVRSRVSWARARFDVGMRTASSLARVYINSATAPAHAVGMQRLRTRLLEERAVLQTYDFDALTKALQLLEDSDPAWLLVLDQKSYVPFYRTLITLGMNQEAAALATLPGVARARASASSSFEEIGWRLDILAAAGTNMLRALLSRGWAPGILLPALLREADRRKLHKAREILREAQNKENVV